MSTFVCENGVNGMKIKKRKLLATITSASFLLNNLGILTLSTTVRADSKMIPETNKSLVSENLEYQYDSQYHYNIVDSINVGGQTMRIVCDEEDSLEVSEPVEEVLDESINEDGEEYPLNIVGELPLDFTSVDQMTTFYSSVFQLDSEAIDNKINELIEQNSDAFYNNNELNGISYDSAEQAVARTIRDIYWHPEEYNIDIDSIRTNEYDLADYSPEELIYKFSHVMGVNPYIALSVAYSEAGRGLDSYNFRVNYNVAGLHPRRGYNRPTNRNGYIIYQNPADGLLDYVVILHDYFYVEETDGINRINTMSRSYSECPSHWRGLVTSNYYNLTENGYASNYLTRNPEEDFIYTDYETEQRLVLGL